MLKCPYCGKDAALVTGDKIYPHRPDLYDRNFWLCTACDAYVGFDWFQYSGVFHELFS